MLSQKQFLYSQPSISDIYAAISYSDLVNIYKSARQSDYLLGYPSLSSRSSSGETTASSIRLTSTKFRPDELMDLIFGDLFNVYGKNVGDNLSADVGNKFRYTLHKNEAESSIHFQFLPSFWP